MLAGGFKISIDVRFRDLDAIGHVNNAVYLTYIESARVAYWLYVTGRTGVDAVDIILARAEVDYRSPVVLGETIEVTVRTLSMRRSSFVLGFTLTERGTGRVVAEAKNVAVYFDYAAGRSQPIPKEIRERIRAQDPDVREES
jgi:acyl-CoA thioester hydrolase